MVAVTLAGWPALIVWERGLAVRHDVVGACDEVVAALATPPKSKVRDRARTVARIEGRLNKPDKFLLMGLNLSFIATFDKCKRGERERPLRPRSEGRSRTLLLGFLPLIILP